MKKYKLIKTYPGSPCFGIEIIEAADIIGRYFIKRSDIWFINNPEKYPEFWEEIIEKDYEILSFYNINKNGPLFKLCIDGRYSTSNEINGIIKEFDLLNHKDKLWTIHSVKRLSDDEIFTIGDKLQSFIIESFKIENFGNGDRLTAQDKNGGIFLSEFKKSKQPLFTTEDGVDIFEGDTFYYVKFKENRFSTGRVFEIVTAKIPGCVYEPKYEKYFSTIEKAKEYILMNKPCLSINDVAKVFVSTNYVKNSGKLYPQGQSLRDMVKKKLSI